MPASGAGRGGKAAAGHTRAELAGLGGETGHRFVVGWLGFFWFPPPMALVF